MMKKQFDSQLEKQMEQEIQLRLNRERQREFVVRGYFSFL